MLALLYVLFAFVIGIAGMSQSLPAANILGVLLLAHGMVIAAYMIHECAHNTVFSNNRNNARLGNVLLWFTGAAYGKYEDIRSKHFRHHVDRADVVAFDYRTRLASYPRLCKIIKALEWVYIPAIEIIMHALVLILPFHQAQRKHLRKHVISVLAIRVLIFALLFAWSPRVVLLYPIAYLLFLTVMRFMDTHQHTYEVFETLDRERGEEARRFNAEYEQRNTFSNLVSVRYPWLNLLTLNFGYHNAHHARPTTPWYRLPALHRELYGSGDEQILPFGNLLRAFHRYRTRRILNADEGDIGMAADKGIRFVGVDGVSFLTAH